MANQNKYLSLINPKRILPVFVLFSMSVRQAKSQAYRTEYKVIQNIHTESDLNMEYLGIATISNSSYLYIQKPNSISLKNEIRKNSANGDIILYMPNQDSLPKIVYRSFDSSIIRYKLGNNLDDIQFYVQEQKGNSINIKILNEYRVINGFNCRKAIYFHPTNPDIPVASAWFCPEINIQAGPADLSGLPGLIIEAEHDQTREKFSLIRFNEIPEETKINFWPPQFNGISFIKLTGISAVKR